LDNLSKISIIHTFKLEIMVDHFKILVE